MLLIITSRTLSTPVLDAASISSTSIEFPEAISRHETHSRHGLPVTPVAQFKPFAKMRAVVVLPVPRTPEKRYA